MSMDVAASSREAIKSNELLAASLRTEQENTAKMIEAIQISAEAPKGRAELNYVRSVDKLV
ncbi:MAG: hypothetical protein LCH38_11690 [Proteobacteria bacterium]|nr:hypothetical protein [Pseudomonadota bacterium]